MDGESVERLMDIILQMKINLAHINETLHEQSFEIRQQLGAVFEEEKKLLDNYLCGIDDKLRECSTSIHEYQRLYASLAAMREKLVLLGGDPSAMPTAFPPDQLEEIVAWRLRQLKDQCKL
jgi:hypothetical protein